MSAEKYDSEAKTLFKAIQDKDEKAVIALCLRTTNDDRLKILNAYKDLYNQDLIGNFKNIFKDNFLKTLIGLFTEPIEYDVNELKEAINTKNVDTLIEIIASRPQEILKQIKDKYNKKYKTNLIKDVTSKTSGIVRKILISLLECKRSTNDKPNEQQCKKIAKEIFLAGEAILGTNESVFIKYFCSLSPEEFIQVANAYPQVNDYKHSIVQAVKKEFSGDSQKALRTITLSILNPPLYYASRVYDAIDRSPNNYNILTRVLASRSGIDMEQINAYYQDDCKREIYNVVREKKISWDYKTLILGIIDKKDKEK